MGREFSDYELNHAPRCVNHADQSPQEPRMTKEQTSELQRLRDILTDTELALQNAIAARELAQRNLHNFIHSLRFPTK